MYRKITIIVLFFWGLPFSEVFAQCWELFDLGNDSLIVTDIFFIDENTGWVSAHEIKVIDDLLKATPVVLKTTDGGENWSSKYVPDGMPHYSYSSPLFSTLYFITPEVGYAFGAPSEGLWKTTNGGDTWFRTTPWPIPNPSYILGAFKSPMQFVSPDTGWISLRWGPLYRTTDGGETWEEQGHVWESSVLTQIVGIAFLDNQTGWVSTELSGLWKTSDGGETWEWETQVSSNHPLSKIHFMNDSVGIVTGIDGVLYKTTDKGVNWDKTEMHIEPDTSNSFHILDFEFYNDTLGWGVVGIGSDDEIGGIVITFDGGKTWQSQSKYVVPPHYIDIRSLDMVSSHKGWAVNFSDKKLLRYNPQPVCNSINNFYVNAEVSNEGVLYSWDPQPGCVDGYKLILKGDRLITPPDSFELLYYYEVDAGLSTSYFYDQPFIHGGSRNSFKVIPYNLAYGEGPECAEGTSGGGVCYDPLPEPIDTFICEGESFYWDGLVFDSLGTYEIPYRNQYNCDSTLVINLLYYQPPAQTLIDTILEPGTSINGITFERDTVFSVLYPAVNTCDSIVTYIVNIVTDTQNPDGGPSWVLYPNPSTQNSVFLTGKEKWQGATLFNVNGQRLRHWTGDNIRGRHRLDMTNIASGVYFLAVEGDQPTMMRLVRL